MKIINKVSLLGFFAISLTSSLSYASGQSAAEATCPACHGVTVVDSAAGPGGVVVNGIAYPGYPTQKVVPQRSIADWVVTIDRMIAKGAGITEGTQLSIAEYLYGAPTGGSTCYKFDGTTVALAGSYSCPTGSSFTPPPACSTNMYMLSPNQKWTCIATPPAPPVICTATGASGVGTYYFNAAGNGGCLY